MKICVFCGSRSGSNQKIKQNVIDLGKIIVENDMTLVYGGGNVGLMGLLANTALEGNSKVIGVIPTFMKARELAHNKLSKMIQVKTMHERKQKMAELADMFLALPGGWGTLDEFAEILTWRQLNLVDKPIGLLNIDGYYNSLIDQFKAMVDNGFLDQENQDLLLIDENIRSLVLKLTDHVKQHIVSPGLRKA